jgi:hypothetical protein
MEKYMDYTSAYSDINLYNDGSGKGAIINPPIAQPMTGQMNMSSLRPGGAAMGNVPQGYAPQQPQMGGMGGMYAGMGGQEEVMEEDYLNSLFDGENLSEDFKFKAKTIFEAAINERVAFIEAHIVQAAKELMAEQTEAAREIVQETTSHSTEALVEHLDQYLSYVINEWMQENQVAIERGLRTEIAENFITQLKDLFESSFIDVPNEKYNVLDDMYAANSELQESLNRTIAENVQLRNEVTARLCAEAFIEESTDLADTQVERLASLAEGIEFDSVDQYRQKVALLKESYFGQIAPKTQQSTQSGFLTENSGSYVATDSANPIMNSVVQAISTMQRNKPRQTQNSERLSELINPGIVQDNFI